MCVGDGAWNRDTLWPEVAGCELAVEVIHPVPPDPVPLLQHLSETLIKFKLYAAHEGVGEGQLALGLCTKPGNNYFGISNQVF